MDKCVGCFRPVTDKTACIACKYSEAHHAFIEAATLVGIEITGEEAEEIKYELYCALQGVEGKQGDKMSKSLLAKIIAKCADTAIYLPKKRFADLDDMKVLLFDLERNAAYITNADVVIRITGLPHDALDGLRNDLPAYDYIGERFIPNPLPYDVNTMDKVFTEAYLHSFTIPIDYVLGNILHSYPEALGRRNCLMVFDVGYGMYENSIIIPELELNDKGKRFYTPPQGDKIVVPDKNSIIANDFLNIETAYVGNVTAVLDGLICTNIYKRFEEVVTFGMYKIMDEVFADDIHPFNLSLYSEEQLIEFPLVSTIDEFNSTADKITVYRNFKPGAIELEYFYETLILYSSFGFNYVNMYVHSPNQPILLEGVRESPEHPLIESVIAPVAIGYDGSVCEAMMRIP